MGRRCPAWSQPLLPSLPLVLALMATMAQSDTVKVSVRETGLCRVTSQDLADAGVRLEDIDAPAISLSCQGVPIPCRVVGAETGRPGPAAAVIFYGEALDTKYTDTNVYWLRWDGEPGPRMGALGAGEPGGRGIRALPTRLRLEENRQYGYLIWPPETGELNPWFWALVTPAEPAEVGLSLPGLAPAGEAATVRVGIRGRLARPGVDPDHHVAVELNGIQIGEVLFDGQAEAVVTGELQARALRPDNNVLVVRCIGDTETGAEDQVFFDWVEVTYLRELRAVDGHLTFHVPNGTTGEARVTGLPDIAADVYRIDSQSEVGCAAGLPAQDGTLGFPLRGGAEARYAVVADGRYLSPAAVSLAAEPSLASPSNRADLVVIAHDSLVDAVTPLVEHRRGQGLQVRVAATSSIYDEFSHGAFDPVAIRRFLDYAYREWERPAPRYVLLVGDASYDYRDHLGTGEPNLVPAYPVRVRNSIETPTDAFYVCLEGDDRIPEMLIGRLPARTPDQARLMCERIVRYETAPPPGDWRRRIILLADHEPTSESRSWFEAASEAEAVRCEAHGMLADRVYLRETGWDAKRPAAANRELVRQLATPPLLTALEDGAALFFFQGHGAVDYLSRQRVLTTADAVDLDNSGRAPVGCLVTCFAGAFDNPEAPEGQCLAEHLLNAPSGLIACIAPSRLGGLNIEEPLLRRLLAAPATPIGAAFAEAKQELLGDEQEQWELVENYNLLGDPLLVLPLEARAPAPLADTDDVPALDLTADADGNGIADVLERHVAEGVYQRYGEPDEKLIALFCRLAGAPSQEFVAAIARLGGRVLDVGGPPWGMEIVLPVMNVVPMTQALRGSLALVQESSRYGQRADTVTVPLRPLDEKTPPE